MKSNFKFRIRKPKHITPLQLALVIFLGVTGGYYIWKPLIVETHLSKEISTTKSVEN